jgi:hypothetical protein
VGIQLKDGRVLRATLCEVERGLFYVTYTMDSAALGKHLLPRYQVGTCASDAQQRIERRARECGYEAVVWEAAPVDPSALPLPAEEATRLAH